MEINESGEYEINNDNLDVFHDLINEVNPSQEELVPNELSKEFRKRISDQNISILNDDSTE
jgi:hypothetical protein